MLEVRNVSVAYGGHQALHQTSLEVRTGETVVILGANGAGKTTLINTIAGLLRPQPGGQIMLRGTEISQLPPHRIVELGVALVPEGRRIFGELTVLENLQLGAFAHRARGRDQDNLERVYALFPRLRERKKQLARTMSGGEQQMLAMGRALMSEPELLLLDEPSLGLSPLLCKELFRILAQINASGVSILLVEQNTRRSLKISHRGYVLENGHIIRHGDTASLLHDQLLAQAYLGL